MVSFPRLCVPQVPAQPLPQIPNLMKTGEVLSGPAWLHPAHLPLWRSRWWKAQNTVQADPLRSGKASGWQLCTRSASLLVLL